MSQAKTQLTPLHELCLMFLKLGVIGFGGPAAHVALMRQELVTRKKWLSDQDFVDLLGATNLIPGPNSTEMAIHVGYLRGKWRGLLAAGVCFIFPAAVIVTAIAWLYVQYGTLPEVEGVLRGVKPVIIVIVLQALWGLGRSVLKRGAVIAAACLSAALNALGVHELAVLFGSGAAMALWRFVARNWGTARLGSFATPIGFLIASSQGMVSVTLSGIFLAFVKIGAVLFGSGYVLLAFLRADFVERLGWLTEAQLLDAVAVGQATPGPTFTTATFIGYVLAGLPGAFVATVGIFLPAFVFVALSGPIVSRIRRSPTASAWLDGINAASLALMAVVTWRLAIPVMVDLPSVAIAVAAGVGSILLHVNVTWLIAGSAVVGYLVSVLR
jgi:chromate transporter